MSVAIAGGHGQIALQLAGRLSGRGESVLSLIRNPDHGDDIRALGAEPVVCDLEHSEAPDIAYAIQGVSAVVFAAGAGPGSGAERKWTVDRDGAIKLLEAAVQAGAPRYLMVSSIGAEAPPSNDDVFSVYLQAKAQADAAIQASDRSWTIVRPGRLTDEPGSGRVRLDREPFRGQVPRADVAAVLDALLGGDRAARQVLYLNSGEDEIEQALEALA
jgi:nucleoside-diphosphate-sugar epimerase